MSVKMKTKVKPKHYIVISGKHLEALQQGLWKLGNYINFEQDLKGFGLELREVRQEVSNALDEY